MFNESIWEEVWEDMRELNSLMDMQIVLPDFVAKAIDTLECNGFEAYLVGGCVRDGLTGVPPKDWDITTNALPDQILSAFLEYKTLTHGIKYGTVTVLIDGMPLEITTYRIDGQYTDHRRPDSVQHTMELYEDLRRRDFTVNALAFNPRTGIIDLFDGNEDLRRGEIRCVGSARERFNEDALRIFRALRFASVLGFEIEAKTAAAVDAQRESLKVIAAERICAELTKMLCGKGIRQILYRYRETIAIVIPEIEPMVGFEQKIPAHALDVWGHTVESAAAIDPIPELRMAMLLHDVAKPQCFTVDETGRGHFYGHEQLGAEMAGEILNRLRFDKRFIKTVQLMIACHKEQPPEDAVQIKEFLKNHGEQNTRLILQVMKADVRGRMKEVEKPIQKLEAIERRLNEIIENKECYSFETLKIDGNGLLQMGFPTGERVGHVLNTLLDHVIKGTCINDGAALVAEAKEIFKEHGSGTEV